MLCLGEWKCISCSLNNQGSCMMVTHCNFSFIMETVISCTPCSSQATFKPFVSGRALQLQRSYFHLPHVGKQKVITLQVILWVLCIFTPTNTDVKCNYLCCRRPPWLSGGLPHQCQERCQVPPGHRSRLFTRTKNCNDHVQDFFDRNPV